MTRHICHECGECFPSDCSLDTHIKTNHNTDPPTREASFQCDVCFSYFSKMSNLNRHRKAQHEISKNDSEKEFKCSECSSSYKVRKSLYRHMREAHDAEKEDKENVNSFECYVCDKLFSSASTLNRHKKDVHKVLLNGGSFKCPLCSTLCQISKDLDIHLEHQHCIKQETNELTLPSIEDFYVWKDRMEGDTYSHYSKPWGSKQVKDGVRSHYFCHRTGSSRTQDEDEKYRIARQPSKKIGAHCPSQIIVTEKKNGEVNVTFSRTHVGHDNNLCFMKLTKLERADLAQRIAKNESLDEILNSVRNTVSQEKGVRRINLLERRDLLNIISDFNLDLDKVHRNDAISVDLWVKEQELLGDDCVVIHYKPQNEQCAENILKKEDFMLVVMTAYQKEMLFNHAENKVLIDSTHGTTEYDFQVTSLMTVDEYGAGIPVGFCISNTTDEVAMKVFFSAIKRKTGTIDSEIFMSDDYPAFYNAWTAIMGPVTHRLLCTWHVDRAWKTQGPFKISSVEKAANVYKGCRVLLEETDVDEFHALLNGFLRMCEEDPETKDFGTYFKNHYANRPQSWAFCYRLRLGLNTNMYLEALHKKLKYIYLDGRKNRRVDKCIASLLKFTRNLMFERLIRHVKNKPTKRMMAITDAHKRMKDVPNLKELSSNEWLVESSAVTRGPYKVVLNDITCSCPLNCPVCRVCIHQVTCECHDNIIKLNICKHIHACLNMSRNSRDSHVMQETELETKAIIQYNSVQAPTMKASVSNQTKIRSMLEMAQSLADKIMPEDEEEACRGTERFVLLLQKLVDKQANSSSVDSIPHFDSQEAPSPANKKVDQQRRFLSTKKKRAGKCERTLTKPGDIQKLVMKEMFKNKEVSDREVISIQSTGDLDHTY